LDSVIGIATESQNGALEKPKVNRLTPNYMERGIVQTSKQISIYTDGSCLGNPGPGGYGIIIVSDGWTEEISGGFRRTTNNRMELLAAIIALESVKTDSAVTVYTDSQYLVNSINKGWAKKWNDNHWVKSDKKTALNPDLWDRLLKLCQKHRVEFVWIRGHHNHPKNDRCDKLATDAARKPDLPADEIYENSKRTMI
jgi:ribonuclease HI